MKSVYIITGGILVRVAIVFLAPQKQTNPKEEASTRSTSSDAYILKEYRDDLPPEVKEIARREIEEDLAREKAEMRKYGRLLTADERYQLEWQAEVEARQEAEFAELYAERKGWIDNFPFQPRYLPIVSDPENNIVHNGAKFRAYQKELGRKTDELGR